MPSLLFKLGLLKSKNRMWYYHRTRCSKDASVTRYEEEEKKRTSKEQNSWRMIREPTKKFRVYINRGNYEQLIEKLTNTYEKLGC